MLEVETPKLALPQWAGLYAKAERYGYPFIRAAAGLIIVPHAFPKLFGTFAPVLAKNVLTPLGFVWPDPLFWAYFLGVLEIVGGLGVAFGLFTRLFALALAIECAIITCGVAIPKGWVYSSPGGGAEFPAILTLLYIGVLMVGPGRCALDRLMAKRWGIGIL